MIRLEDADFVRDIFESESCIILPIEISCLCDGSVDILVYPMYEKIAEEFEKCFGNDPFSDKAAAFLMTKLSPEVEKLGYSTAGADTHAYREYRCEKPNTAKILPGCELISTLDGETWDEIDLDGFELDPENESDRMAVIRMDGRIVCYAGLNDVCEDDGLYEITVECEEEYRNNGYAKACVAKLTQHILDHGESVKYICTSDNIASIRTAEAVGFKPYKTCMPFVSYKITDEDEEE